MFRDLRAEEIECRVARATEKGVSLLLYKDARCDQNILDETVGPMNWQRQHCRENANCIVSLWDDKKQQWISKEDTGTESQSEAQKGLASDSFKRACFNWGIGRELYTAPFIWIGAVNCLALELDNRKNKWACNDKFVVDSIAIENKRIVAVTIKNAKSGKVCFQWWQEASPKKLSASQMETIMNLCNETGTQLNNLLKYFEVIKLDELTEEQSTRAIKLLEAKRKKAAE